MKSEEGTVDMSQSQFKGSLIEVRHSVTAASAFAQLFEVTHPEHAEALEEFCERLQKSCRELGDVIYTNNPQVG